MFRDALRWIYMKCGMYRAFAPSDLTFASFVDKFTEKSRKKEAAQEWERRRSEQMAKEAEDRRVATRRAAVADNRQPSDTIPPETPMEYMRPNSAPQTGMLAVYQKMNYGAGRKRTATNEMV